MLTYGTRYVSILQVSAPPLLNLRLIGVARRRVFIAQLQTASPQQVVNQFVPLAVRLKTSNIIS